MKKVNKQSQVKTIIYLNENLIEGAKLLVREIKTPAALLDFINESLWWMQEFDKEQKAEPDNFCPRMMIELVVQPWFAGGNDVTMNIAKGLGKFINDGGVQDFEYYICNLIQAFGLSSKSGFYCDSDKYLRIIGTLIHLNIFMSNYVFSIKKDEGNLCKIA